MGKLANFRPWAPMIAAASGRNDRQRMVREPLERIALDPVPHRPDRVEPEAVKRRPKNFARLNKPRHEFREIAHRNRYAKTLTWRHSGLSLITPIPRLISLSNKKPR